MQINIKNLKFKTFVGIHPHEKANKQTIELNVKFNLDDTLKFEKDDISETIDYDSLSKDLEKYISSQHFNLIEKMAYNSAHYLLEKFDLKNIELEVIKPDALSNAIVSAKKSLNRS
jgi:FolB domain-containing protein